MGSLTTDLAKRRSRLVIVAELHGECPPTLRSGSESGGIPEHFRKRDTARENLERPCTGNMRNFSMPGIEIADDIASKFLRDSDLGFHDRFEEEGGSPLAGVFKCHGSSHLECHHVRCFLYLDIQEACLHIKYGIA